jgi:hypothetical protein
MNVTQKRTTEMPKQFKIKWAESECDAAAERVQTRAIKKLSTLLKADGFEMSHTDDAGFTVYLPTGKPKPRRKSKPKPKVKPWLVGMVPAREE